MRRNKLKKIKAFILINLLRVSVILALLSTLALDSESYIPMIVLGVSLLYILCFMKANTRG